VARAPLVPFSVFRSRLVSAGNALSFLSFLPVMAIWFFLTLYLQDVRGYTALQAGLVFLPMSLAVAAGTQAGFKVIGRADTRLLFLTGGLTAAGGAAWLAQLTPSGGVWAVIVPACLAMAGGGLMSAPIMAAATAGLPPGQGGLASGLLNTSRQVGGALGLAILASVGATHAGTQLGVGHATLTAGFGAVYGVAAGIFAATATIGSLILPRQVSTPKSGESAQENGEGNQ
jgi:MFS family permease